MSRTGNLQRKFFMSEVTTVGISKLHLQYDIKVLEFYSIHTSSCAIPFSVLVLRRIGLRKRVSFSTSRTQGDRSETGGIAFVYLWKKAVILSHVFMYSVLPRDSLFTNPKGSSEASFCIHSIQRKLAARA